MKEQLERMFPGAVVTVAGGTWTAKAGRITVKIIEHAWGDGCTTNATFDDIMVTTAAHGSDIASSVALFRSHVAYAADKGPTKTARARAARVLRVLDAAKVGEVTL